MSKNLVNANPNDYTNLPVIKKTTSKVSTSGNVGPEGTEYIMEHDTIIEEQRAEINRRKKTNKGKSLRRKYAGVNAVKRILADRLNSVDENVDDLDDIITLG